MFSNDRSLHVRTVLVRERWTLRPTALAVVLKELRVFVVAPAEYACLVGRSAAKRGAVHFDCPSERFHLFVG